MAFSAMQGAGVGFKSLFVCGAELDMVFPWLFPLPSLQQPIDLG